MHQLTQQKPLAFVDRRNSDISERPLGAERRQFQDSHQSGRPEARELGEAVDNYKLRHRRRFITFEELYEVIADLGYHK